MGNLLRAAEKLFITQPAISKALTVIEEDIGVRLFERTPYGARATPAGEIVIRHGRNVLSDIKRMQDDLEATLRGDIGTLRLGVFSVISNWEALTKAIIRSKQKAPGLTLVLETGKMEDLIEKLDGGRVDMLIGRYPHFEHQERHEIRGLVRDRIAAVARSEHPIFDDEDPPTLERLLDFDWILPPKGNYVRAQFEMEVSSLGRKLNETSIVSLSIPVNTGLVRETNMIMIMPSCVARSMEKSHGIQIIPFDLPQSVGPLVAVWRVERQVDMLRDLFLSELDQAILEERAGVPV